MLVANGQRGEHPLIDWDPSNIITRTRGLIVSGKEWPSEDA